MIYFILVGAALVLVLGLLVNLLLDDLAENHEGPGVVPYDSPREPL